MDGWMDMYVVVVVGVKKLSPIITKTEVEKKTRG
jgi:hypothetical protein